MTIRYYARRGGRELRVIQVFRRDDAGRFHSWDRDRGAWVRVPGDGLARYLEEQLTVDELAPAALGEVAP